DPTNLQCYHAGLRINYQLDRRHSLLVGYHYGRASYGVDSTMLGQHAIESGMTYARPLSRSRHLTIELTVGATNYEEGIPFVPPIATLPESTESAADSQAPTQAPAARLSPTHRTSVTGGGPGGYETSGAWPLTGDYQRGLSYIDSLQNAVFSDAVTVSTRGFINRRTDLVASGSYASGDLAITPAVVSSYLTTGASVRIRVALIKMLAAYGEYLRY